MLLQTATNISVPNLIAVLLFRTTLQCIYFILLGLYFQRLSQQYHIPFASVLPSVWEHESL